MKSSTTHLSFLSTILALCLANGHAQTPTPTSVSATPTPTTSPEKTPSPAPTIQPTPTPTITPRPTPTAPPLLSTLSLQIPSTPVDEGSFTSGQISLARTRDSDVVVTLRPNVQAYSHRVGVPRSVIIRAGQTQVSFPIEVAQDELVNVPNFVEISASSPGFSTTTTRVFGRNDDRPRLRLTLDVTTVREDGGEQSVRATLSSNDARFGTQPVTLRSSAPDVAQVPSTIDFVAGSERVFFVALQPNIANNAPRVITISAESRNADADFVTLTVLDANAPRLTLSISPPVVEEAQGATAARGILMREGDLSEGISIALSSSNPSQARVQPSIVFPVGSNSVSFPIGASDDGLRNRAQNVEITANAVGPNAGTIASARASITVRDSTPFVTAYLTRTSFAESAGPRASFLVLKLSRAQSREVRVPLGVGNTRLIAPRSAVFAPGKTLISVPIGVRDDNRTDSSGNDYISYAQPFPFASTGGGSAGGGGPNFLFVTVFEDDTLLFLTLTQTEFSEGAGENAARATVTRRLPTDEPLTVLLFVENAEDDQSRERLVRVPSRIVIPPKLSSVSFPIDILSNSTKDTGAIPQTRFLVARTRINSQPVQAVQARVPLFIFDDEPGELLLELDSDVVGESGIVRTFATLRLPSAAGSDTTFTIKSNNPSRLRVPNQIVLLAGRSSVTFPVDAIDNTQNDGDATIQITASKTGFISSTATITVIDDDSAT